MGSALHHALAASRVNNRTQLAHEQFRFPAFLQPTVGRMPRNAATGDTHLQRHGHFAGGCVEKRVQQVERNLPAHALGVATAGEIQRLLRTAPRARPARQQPANARPCGQ